MRYNIRLTIKAIIRAEQMLGKPFTDFDYTDREELTRLLYCSVLANNKERMAYGTFLEVAGNEKQLSAMLSEMELENVLLVQFTDTVDKLADQAMDNACATWPQTLSYLAGWIRIMSWTSWRYRISLRS